MIEGPRFPDRSTLSLPRWARPLGIAFAAAGGFALALSSTGSAGVFEPPAGPPDSLRVLHTAIPKPAVIAQTRYLRRLTEPKSGPERELADLAERYRVTRPLARRIYETALAEGIDPELAFRLIRVESVFDEDAVGPGGALGLTQLMYGTAREIDPSVRSRSEVLDARTNMHLGFTNLRNMIRLFDGDVRLGVIAYNRGEIAVQRALRRGRDPENGYGERVLGARHHGGRPYRGPGLVPRRHPARADSTAPSPAAR